MCMLHVFDKKSYIMIYKYDWLLNIPVYICIFCGLTLVYGFAIHKNENQRVMWS